MNESTLFQRTLIALGATILVPLSVAATGVGGNDMSVQDRLKEYVSVAVAPRDDQSDDTSKDNESKSNENSESDKNGKEESNESQTNQPTGYADAKKSGTYTVKEGDTYGCIAEKYYGSYDQWSRVFDENAGWPGFDEYRLDVGAKLQMPAVDSSQALPKTNLCQ